ncbi:MAG: tyrosine-type recombinase/integrase [Sedimentisphaerales bacterium]
MPENSPHPIVKLFDINTGISNSSNPGLAEAGSPQLISAEVVVRQATTDEQVIELWLHGRSPHTQKAYRKDIRNFVHTMNKPFAMVTLGDLQNYADSLAAKGLKDISCHRILSSVKSLFTFAHKLGLLFDVGRPLKLPKYKDELAERILSEAEIHRIIDMEHQPRNRLLLRLLYLSGIRVSEVCRLTWSNMTARDNSQGQMTIFGKGSKTNNILLPASLWIDLMAFKNAALDTSPVFRSRKGGHLTAAQVWNIVKKAAKRAGISKAVSPHWFRHGSASHSISRGANISLVSATLGHASILTTSKYIHCRPEDSSSLYLEDV